MERVKPLNENESAQLALEIIIKKLRVQENETICLCFVRHLTRRPDTERVEASEVLQVLLILFVKNSQTNKQTKDQTLSLVWLFQLVNSFKRRFVGSV